MIPPEIKKWNRPAGDANSRSRLSAVGLSEKHSGFLESQPPCARRHFLPKYPNGWLVVESRIWSVRPSHHPRRVDRDRQHATDLGLPEAAWQEIMSYSPTNIDPIRLAAVRCGLVRIREHRRHVSVQYWAEAERADAVLAAVVKALTGLEIHPDTRLEIDNLLAGDSRVATLGGLQADVVQGT